MPLKKLFVPLILLCFPLMLFSQSGYYLWLQYDKIEDSDIKKLYLDEIKGVKIFGTSESMEISGEELKRAYQSFLNEDLTETKDIHTNTMVLKI